MLRRVLGKSAFATAFIGFFLLAAAWAFAMPYDGPADEFQHVVRAYGVLDGQVSARVDARVTVPQSLVPANVDDTHSCVRWVLGANAGCMGQVDAQPGDTTKMVVTGSGAANYNPLYYAVVGWPIKLWPTYTGIIAARLLTGVVTSGLLAGAVAVAARLRRRGSSGAGFLLAGTVAAATPIVVNMTGAVNPAGVEMAAGIGLWAGLIAVVDGRDDSKRVLALLGVSAVLMAVLRELGIAWLGASVVIAAFGLTRDRWRVLVRRKTFLLWAAGVFAACVYGAYWILTSTQGGIRTSTQDNPLPPLPFGKLLVKELTHRVPSYLTGFVGLPSYGNFSIPLPLTIVWWLAVALLLILAVRTCGRRVTLQILAILGGAFTFLIGADLKAYQGGFWLSQGRYALPLLVGAPMVAAYALGSRGVFSPQRQRKLVKLFAAVLLPIQGVTLWIAMLRFEHGFKKAHPNLVLVFPDLRSVDPFTGAWMLPVGPWLAVLLCVAGIGVLMCQFVAFADAGTVAMSRTAGTGRAAGTAPTTPSTVAPPSTPHPPADTSPSASAPARP